METVWRVAFVYFFLVVVLRMMGKRDLGQLSPFDLVILLLIPQIFAQSLIGEDYSLTNAIIGVSTLLSLAFLTSVLAHLSKPVERLVSGSPSVLVHHGYLVPEVMNRERVAPEEILAHMHMVGLERISQVKWGILEPDGTISFIPWEQGGIHEGSAKKKLR